jgi:hypothetical protein
MYDFRKPILLLSACALVSMTPAHAQSDSAAPFRFSAYQPGLTIEIMGDDTSQVVAAQAGAGARFLVQTDLHVALGFNVTLYNRGKVFEPGGAITLGANYLCWKPAERLTIHGLANLIALTKGVMERNYVQGVIGLETRWNLGPQGQLIPTTESLSTSAYVLVGYGNDFSISHHNEILSVGLVAGGIVNLSLNVSSLWKGASPHLSYLRFR